MAEQTTHGFTRRSFIKGAAALTAAGALVGCSPKTENLEETDAKKEAPETQMFAGYCAGNCGGGCWLNVHVRDDQVVRTTARDMPDTAYNRICSKGATHVGRIYSAKRVLYPMKRVGERGSGEFERISWDEAIKTICDNWKSITDQYGPAAFGIEWGSGNYSLANGTCNGLSSYQLLMNITGATEMPLNVDAGVGFGTQHAHGGMSTSNGLGDRINAKTQVMWGCNPPNALPQIMHFLMEAKENGTRYIVIDPLYDTNASKADWWLPIKAATDGALALGVLNVLFSKGWIEEDVIKNKTNCPFLVKEDGTFLRMSDLGVEPTEGEVNPLTGKPTVVDPIALWDKTADAAVPYTEASDPAYTDVADVDGIKVRTAYDIFMESINQYPPETASEICGLGVADIEELARVYHEDGPVSTEMMQGMNHYRNAHYATWPMVLISMLTGNTGAKGASYGQTEEYLTQLSFCNRAALMPKDAQGNPCKGSSRTVQDPYLLEATESGYKGDGIPLKGAYLHGCNPCSTFAEHDNTTKWMDNLDFMVCADSYMTETMKYADIILPSAHWFEKEDLGFLFATHPYVCWNDKAIEPQGEAKADFDIFGMIAEGLGLGDMWPESSRAYIEALLDTDQMRSMGITLDKIVEAGAVSLHPGDEAYVTDTSVTKNETGRIFVYREDVLKMYDVGQEIDPSTEQVPQFVEATFMGENSEYRAKYPYHLMSEKMRTHTHSQWADCEYVKEYEPEPICRLNPDDAAELGIKENDQVKLSNDLGFVVMKAVINAGVPAKTITAGRSWNAEDFIDGHYSSLSSIGFNQTCANQAFNDVAVTIEKM